MNVPIIRSCSLYLLSTLIFSNAFATTLELQLSVSGQPSSQIVVLAHPIGAPTIPIKPTVGHTIAQQNKNFIPSVSVVAVGSSVSFPNEDTVRHHVYSFSEAKTFEIKLYTGTPSAPIVFDKPGVVVLGCNIHDDMASWLVVSPTPFFTQTDASGKARMELPEGHYHLDFFHPQRPNNAPFERKTLHIKGQTVVHKADVSLR